MSKFTKLEKLNKYGAAISFLAMEIFALIAFSFGSSFVLYGSLSLALAVLLVLFNIKEINSKGLSSIGLFLIPLFLFTLLTAIGLYSRAHYLLGDFSLADLIFIPLGLLPIAFCGYLLSIDKTFKLSTFLIVIYSALGILSIINLIVNLVNFGAFYTIIYSDYYMYYGGQISSVAVGEFAYVLEGLKFIEVKISHYALYPSLLLTSSIALFFISPKKNLKLFIIYAAFSFVGVLALVLVPTLLSAFTAFIVLAIDLVIFLIKRFNLKFKAFKIAIIAGLSLMAIVVLVMIVNNTATPNFVTNLIKNSSLLNRIFNGNRIVSKFNPLVYDLFSTRFLGFYDYPNPSGYGTTLTSLSGSLLFDSFMTSGVIGLVALIVVIVMGYKSFAKYFRNPNLNEEFYVKTALLAFTLFFFTYSLLFNEGEYGIFYDIHKPIYMSGPFMICLFIFGYIFSKVDLFAEESAPVEVNSNEQ